MGVHRLLIATWGVWLLRGPGAEIGDLVSPVGCCYRPSWSGPYIYVNASCCLRRRLVGICGEDLATFCFAVSAEAAKPAVNSTVVAPFHCIYFARVLCFPVHSVASMALLLRIRSRIS